MIDIVGRQTGYSAIDPFLEDTFTFPPIFNLEQVSAAVFDTDVVDRGKLTPPGMVRLFLKLIFNIYDKFAVMGLKQFACGHLGPP
jgi:hypothetical protein